MASLSSSSSWGANITHQQFKIGLCQLSVSTEKETNLASARSSIELAVKQGAALVVLPEMWNCPYSSDCFAKFAEDFNDKNGCPSFSMLSELATCHNITIVGGSVPELDNNNIYNTCCVFGPNGKLLAKHRKLHLFDIQSVAPGELSFKESDSFTAGDKPTIVDTDVCRIGIGICHDIRFPELAMLYQARGVELICYPGAFNVNTGSMLWELEQRARAVDNQICVATCSPSRNSSGSYEIWGHSTLVGPAGEVIAKLGHEEAVLVAEIDLSTIYYQRQSIPLHKHKQSNIYGLIDLKEEETL
uniref:omega-amidase, chloroplastic-like isoform X2 n=1 Tax=Erigeron canadensis TaxID=72917 RepID=UPI001CB94740|nr:omega-amidase, chloroplastic-like isoform X2 [Erigeron canadensis]